MSLSRFELNQEGIRELLNSDEVGDYLTEVGEEVARRAGSGYAAADPHHSGQRLIVNVYTENLAAYRDNLRNNTLLKAIGGGVT